MKLGLGLLLASLGHAQKCRDQELDGIFGDRDNAIDGAITNKDPLTCDFTTCEPLFLGRVECQRIGIGYSTNMVGSGYFQFFDNPDVPKRDFVKKYYNPILDSFKNKGQAY